MKTRSLTALICALMFAVPMLAAADPVRAPLVKDSANKPIGALPVITVDTTGAYVAAGGSTNISAVGGNAVTTTLPVSGTVAATQSGAWNITNVSGTVSLPTGASTAANQATGNASLANIETNTSGLLKAPSGFQAGTVFMPVGKPLVVTGTITPSTSAYALAQPIGDLVTVDVTAAAGVSMANKWVRITAITAVLRADAAPTSVPMAPVIFDENPTASTFTDRTTTVLAAADFDKVVTWTSGSALGGSNVVGNAIAWRNEYNGQNAILVQLDANGRFYVSFTVGGAVSAMTNPNFAWRVMLGFDPT